MKDKYYEFEWEELLDKNWDFLVSFIKANTNIIELSMTVFPYIWDNKTNIHKFAESELNELTEIELFEQTLKPIYKYVSYVHAQKVRSNPMIYYRIISANELVDKFLLSKTTNEFWEMNLSFPSFYNDIFPLVWFAESSINIALNSEQKKLFIEQGFQLKLNENQSFPTEPIDNFNESDGIRNTIKSVINFGNQQHNFESLQDFNPFLIPKGEQKVNVIGIFYANLYLKYLYSEPEFTVEFSEKHETEFFDILIKKTGLDYKKIQVKTVTMFSKTRYISTIKNCDKFDELLVVSLDKTLYPRGIWFLEAKEIENTKRIIAPGFYIDSENEKVITFKGSRIFKNKENKINDFLDLMSNNYNIVNYYP